MNRRLPQRGNDERFRIYVVFRQLLGGIVGSILSDNRLVILAERPAFVQEFAKENEYRGGCFDCLRLYRHRVHRQ